MLAQYCAGCTQVHVHVRCTYCNYMYVYNLLTLLWSPTEDELITVLVGNICTEPSNIHIDQVVEIVKSQFGVGKK